MSLSPWELENIKKDHINAIRKAHYSHEQKRYALARLLEKLYRIKPEEIIMEKKISGGSIDLEVGNVIFEVKAVLEKELPKAQEQLKKYIETIYAEEKKVKIGIVTDGLKFIAYEPVINKRGRVVDLREIGSRDIIVDDPQEFISWFRALIFEEKRDLGLGALFELPKSNPSAPERRFGLPAPTKEERKGIDLGAALENPLKKVFKGVEEGLKMLGFAPSEKRSSKRDLGSEAMFKLPKPDLNALERMFSFPAPTKGGKMDLEAAFEDPLKNMSREMEKRLKMPGFIPYEKSSKRGESSRFPFSLIDFEGFSIFPEEGRKGRGRKKK